MTNIKIAKLKAEVIAASKSFVQEMRNQLRIQAETRGAKTVIAVLEAGVEKMQSEIEIKKASAILVRVVDELIEEENK